MFETRRNVCFCLPILLFLFDIYNMGKHLIFLQFFLFLQEHLKKSFKIRNYVISKTLHCDKKQIFRYIFITFDLASIAFVSSATFEVIPSM